MIKLKANKVKSRSLKVNQAQYLRNQGFTVAMISARLGIKESVVHALLGGAL